MRLTGIDSIETNTGHRLAEWYRILDSTGGTAHSRSELAQVLTVHFGVPEFWAHCIASCYCRDRGMPVFELPQV